ncbi:MAG: hypothetical protein JRJ65_17070 [Deltaproteobacteria bacterium]|nr:hypothetical protein [Deltaproteobacteria bacterium]
MLHRYFNLFLEYFELADFAVRSIGGSNGIVSCIERIQYSRHAPVVFNK